MEKVSFTRSELYDLVWKRTLSFITKKYGISSVGVRKACEQLQIPLPTNSHWSDIQYSKSLHIVRLPENYEGVDTIEILKKKFEINTKTISEPTPLIKLTNEIQNDLKAPLAVADRLVKPDILVLQTKQHWDRKSKGNSYVDSNDVLPIYVEQNSLDRALRFFDGLIKLLKYRGHYIKKGKDGRNTVVFIDGIEIRLYLREATRRVVSKKQNYNYEYIPTGEFVFQISEGASQKEWRDSKTSLLEDILARIVAKLELNAKMEKVRLEEYRISEIKREQDKVLKKIFLERRQKELSNFKQLLSDAERLDKTTKLRNYIKTVEEKAIAGNSLNEDLVKWISWAKYKIDCYDPLIEKVDDYLNEYDFENLK